MRIVIAPDSLKGSLRAREAARALAEGWRAVRPDDDLVLLPMADGGEGTLDAFLAAVPGAQRIAVRVTGPAGTPVDTAWVRLPPADDAPHGTAVVELAATCGIELLDELRPLDADTTGVGEAISAALAAGVSRVFVGLGSSASTDGGGGMLRALGARLLDVTGAEVAPGGRGLADLARVDLVGLPAVPSGGIVGLTDVTNPLLGVHGAAAVFGPQKGADRGEVRALDAGLGRLARFLGRSDLAEVPGAGAAGGTGFGLLLWGGRLESGAAAIADLVGLREAAATADLVITGEGSYDAQSARGKVAAHVVEAAGSTPVALVAGRIAKDADTSAFTASVSLTALARSAADAMDDPRRWLRAAGSALAFAPR